MERKFTQTIKQLDNVGAGTTTGPIDVRSFRFMIISAAPSTGGNFTLRVLGSVQDDVDFGSAASITNQWEEIDLVSIRTGASAGTSVLINDEELYEVNANALTKIAIEVSAFTGTGTVWTKLFDAQ